MVRYRSTSIIDPIAVGACVVLLLLVLGVAVRADRVTLAAEEDGGGGIQIEGDIVEYTGSVIRIRNANGVERNYAASRVRELEADWLQQHADADETWRNGDVAAALRQYSEALAAEERVWVRRLILSRICLGMWAQGQVEQAASRFLALVASDPQTPHAGVIPLAWEPSEAVAKSTALGWLGQTDRPWGRLLGASYLLASDHRLEAGQTLQQLSRDADQRIASLATAQLWRIEAFRADETLVAKWQNSIEEMPIEVRAGPYYLVGRTWLRLERYEDASLTLLHVRILYPDIQWLAASSLLQAAESQQRAGMTEQASQLLRELESVYRQSPRLDEARRLLQALSEQP
ncbi:MAG: hypothetical protein KDA42_01480 [Planctomycetales bacterium]|nr:hypothetical protein [Planctomycetales bacterium]